MASYQSPGVYVEEVSSGMKPIAGVGTSTAGFIGFIPDKIFFEATEDDEDDAPPESTGLDDDDTDVDDIEVSGATPAPVVSTPPSENDPSYKEFRKLPDEGDPRLCTNFSEFTEQFGSFGALHESSTPGGGKIPHPGHSTLAHAVYGFFNNGGTRCFVARVKTAETVSSKDNKSSNSSDKSPNPLVRFEEKDEIALISFPGATDKAVQEALLSHCESQGRFAILDSPEKPATLDRSGIRDVPSSSYGAIYYPWIKVFDPVDRGSISMPPSGHIAGAYARVDATRGVFKSPANERIRGALDVETAITKAKQDGLNPDGINVIRKFDSDILLWGARTLASGTDSEWQYINVRRLFLFLIKSIESGTQWVVFEPNDPALWAKITRNITAFLTNVWLDGALLGNTPQEAFYVKCDGETNSEVRRNNGQVVTEIGVAVTKPAEFVIFRISQWSGNGN
jgi:hypothetical protein